VRRPVASWCLGRSSGLDNGHARKEFLKPRPKKALLRLNGSQSGAHVVKEKAEVGRGKVVVLHGRGLLFRKVENHASGLKIALALPIRYLTT
jgi:hypothetical protein